MRAILYANLIAIFIANKALNRDESENVLNKDIHQLAAYIIKNNLVVIMRKSETESSYLENAGNCSAIFENLKRLTA